MIPEQPPEDDSDEFEDVLAELIEAYAERGAAAMEAACRQHPRWAFRLRARLADLERMGLLGDAGERLPQAIGPYEVLEAIGAGGMSRVFLVRRSGRLDEGKTREEEPAELALKAMVSWGLDVRARMRFEREVQAISQLQHPSIVAIHEVGEDNERPYFTMDFVRGASLAEVLDQLRAIGPRTEELTAARVFAIVREQAAHLPVEPPERGEEAKSGGYIELVCNVVLAIADALGLAHSRGIVHRDVKPSNIMLGPDGRAQLLDFGLAHLEREPTLTATGDFTGTPHYVAPEQLGPGRAVVDARTDVYGLGVTLYELLTFARPFEGGGAAAVLHRVQTKEANPPRSVQAGIPRDLETICMTAMDRDRQRRYASMAELAADLRRFLEFRPVAARPLGFLPRLQRRARANPAWAAAWSLGLVLVASLPAGLLWSSAQVRTQRDAALEAAAEAGRQAALSQRVTSYLLELLQPAAGSAPDAATQEVLRGLFEQRLEELAPGAEGDPRVRAELLDTSGRVVANLGLAEQAVPYFDRAYMMLRGELGAAHPRVLEALLRLARVHLTCGDSERARDIALRGLEAGRSELAEAFDRVLAESYLAEGRAEEARSVLRSLRTSPGWLVQVDPDLRSRLLELEARAVHELGERRDASLLLQQAIQQQLLLWQPDPDLLWGWARSLTEWDPQAGTAQRWTPGWAERRAAYQQASTRPLPSPPMPLVHAERSAFSESFQRGVGALQARGVEEAIQCFQRCIELRPDHAVSHYNLACAFAQGGQVEPAVDALEGAVSTGYGSNERQWQAASKDSDLDPLRATRRGRDLMERMQASFDNARAEQALFLEGAEDGPLWLVLHGEGSRGSQVAEGPLGASARSRGAWLSVPRAGLAMGERPSAGRRWFSRFEDVERLGAGYEADLIAHVSGLLEQRAWKGGEILLIGEGQGALLAWDLALRYPGLFRRVVLLDGPPDPRTRRERTRIAALLGLQVDFVLGPSSPANFERHEATPQTLAEETLSWALTLGLDARAHFEWPVDLR